MPIGTVHVQGLGSVRPQIRLVIDAALSDRAQTSDARIVRVRSATLQVRPPVGL